MCKKNLLILLVVCAISSGGFAETTTETTETPDVPETPEVDVWAPIVDETREQGLFAYDVDDYVQDGLVAHFDAICNAGADQPHDPAATTWRNLVAGAPDAIFVKQTGDTGDWTANGYAFAGKSYAQLADPGVALGPYLTIQLATTVDYAVQKAGSNIWPALFSGPNDHGIFFNNNNGEGTRSSTLNWKTDGYGASDNTTRPSLKWSEGRYLTAMLDETHQRMFAGTDRAGGAYRERLKTAAFPQQRWTFGGSSYQNGHNRDIIGTIHSVRLYNRVLTDDELALHRKIDDIRFRGIGGNVHLQTSLSGAEGSEASGIYDVNGSYAFTTPASVNVEGAVYAPAGYQLETWNALSNVWEFVEVSDDTTFTYTNCLARPCVRLTWLWRMTGGQRRLDADAYAPLGLIGNWDGIRNAGVGVAHDAAATTWTNCVANGVDAQLLSITNTMCGAWERIGYCSRGGDVWKMKSKIDFGHNWTIQSVTDTHLFEQKTRWPTLFGTTADVGNIYWAQGQGSLLNFKCDAIVGGSWENMAARATLDWHGGAVTAFVAFDRTGLSGGTTLPTFKAPISYKGPIGARTFYFGGIPAGDTAADQIERGMIGTLFATRAYTRILTPVELAWNRLVDDARFRGVASVAATGLVEVVGSAVKGYGADDGVCLMLDGERSFTVPASVEHAGVRYVCAGYRLETADATLKSFTTAETHADMTTCTLAADTTRNRRIVWLWRAENRLRTAADYDVDDYVQEGLVAHFDAIRNVSAALPHNPTADSWRDLSEQRNRAVFRGKNVTQGCWTNGCAYSFNQSSYAQMTNLLALGKTITIEQALDIDLDGQTQGYPTYVGMVDDYGVFTRSDNKRRLEWKNENVCCTDNKHRPMQYDWQGKYLVALVDDTRSYLFEGTSLANVQTRSAFNTFGSRFWSIGAAADGGSGKVWAESRYSKGFQHAVRFYNRPLTEAELVQNRKVDEIRFRGAVVTNVVVASGHPEAHGVETNGVYEVEGSWTFTAQPTVLESGKTVRPTGYTLETLANGVWGARTSHTGTSYTYTAGADAKPVRLTWRYSQGITILVR